MSSESAKVFLDIHKELVKLNHNQETVNDNIKRLSKTVYGDGNGDKGLVIRVDRVKRNQDNIIKAAWTSITGVAGLATKAIYEFIKN